jgi:Domain of unknown function (DUF6894)
VSSRIGLPDFPFKPILRRLRFNRWTPPIIDRDGEEFPDDKAAYAHAIKALRQILDSNPTFPV